MENRQVLLLEFARLSLQLRLTAVPQWIMEKMLIRYRGNVKVHLSVFLALLTECVEILTQLFQHFNELGRRGELKRPTTPYTYVPLVSHCSLRLSFRLLLNVMVLGDPL